MVLDERSRNPKLDLPIQPLLLSAVRSFRLHVVRYVQQDGLEANAQQPASWGWGGRSAVDLPEHQVAAPGDAWRI